MMLRLFMRGRMKLADEHGATVVIVALSLVAMFGMLVLVVDVGGLLWKRRELVNGSDSAALAVAKSCADEADATIPETQSDTYATENVTGLGGGDGGIIQMQNCDSGHSGFVTVQYHQNQKLYFAQVLGFASTNGVTTKATAAWGPLSGGNVVPIVVESGQLQGTCAIPSPDPVDPNDPPLCPLWYDNNTLGAADWGFMNLDQWGVTPDANCSNAGTNDRRDWILKDYTKNELLLNGDPLGSEPTYVCVDTGHSAADWQDLFDRMADNPFVLLPVNDCSGQLDAMGNVTPCPATPDKYDIIGFIKLKLINVLKGNDQTLADGTPCAVDCGGTPPTLGSCNNVGLPGATTVGTYNLGGWALDPLAVSSCGASKTPDTITNVVVTNGQGGGNKVTFVGCTTPAPSCDYIYDPAVTPHQLDWYKALTRPPGPNTYKISLDWSINGIAPTPGICGEGPSGTRRSSDPNAICLQMAYMGFSTGGNKVGVGELFGTFGYVLCDRDLGTCPDQ
jgi:Flp pilus assembly protein TadG